MSKAPSDEYDLVAFELAQVQQDAIDVKAGRTPRRSIESRAAREKKRIDGGRQRRTNGRTSQLNVTIYPAIKERLLTASDDYRLTLVELVEAALTEFLDGDGPRKLVSARLNAKGARHA
jgi:hypothetical protein